MASLHEHRKGRWRLKFVVEKQCRVIYLPKGIREAARVMFRARIEELVACKLLNSSYSPELMTWLNGLSHEMLSKLSDFALVSYRITPDLTLVELVDEYIERRRQFVSTSTLRVWELTRNKLAIYFGDLLAKALTPAHASDFAEGIDGAPSTKRQLVAKTKQFLKDAVKRGLIDSNAFEDQNGTTLPNPERASFVSRESVDRVLEFCDPDLQLIVMLSRYAGLRVPSEAYDLTWSDVLPDRLVIKKHKTKSRAVPIFPELAPYLRRAFEHAQPGVEHVVPNKVSSRLKRAIERSGVECWPRVWHNMRATRQTELTETYPEHVVCAWLGNSPNTAKAHYLQVTDEHFQNASAPQGAPQYTPTQPNTPQQQPIGSTIKTRSTGK